MSSSTSYYFPPEIWLRIFRIATTCPAYQKLFATEYQPFYGLTDKGDLEMLSDVRSTKAILVLVCKQWQNIAARFFYEDIRVSHRLQGLYDSLKRSIDEVGGKGYGAFVRRIELSMIEFNDPDRGIRNWATLADILGLCPRVEIITKTHRDLLPHAIDPDSFSEPLKRFDWWFPTHRAGLHRISADYDDPSEGIDFLHDVTSRASNMRYLSIGIKLSYTTMHFHTRLLDPFPGRRFPALTTLRIECLNPAMMDEIQHWEFPCLTHLITDRSLCLTDLSKLGARVEVLELIRGGGLMESLNTNDVAYLLAGFPNLLELNFYIEYSHPLPERRTGNSSIRCIRLHGLLNRWFGWHEESVDRPTERPLPSLVWRHYEDHFRIFSTSFPALECIVLHGDWSTVIRDSRFHLLKDPLIARGCVLQYDHDNGVVDILS